MAQPQVKEALDMFGMEAAPGTPEELATTLRKAADKKLAEEYLLDTSMISGLREAARIE